MIKKYIKSEFVKNVLTLFSGASIAQFIPILVSPVLSRIYAPENFGQLGVIMSVVGIFSIVATFQYESAIMLPKKDEDAFNLLVLAVSITFFISVLSYILVNTFDVQIARILKSRSFINWVFIIPILVFLSGLFNSLNIWASRKKQFKRLAFRQIAQTTVGAGTKLTLGWLKYVNSGLIWGTLAGQLTSTGVLTVKTFNDTRNLFSRVSLRRIKYNALLYQDFPKYTMWQGFFDLVNASGTVFILSSFYGLKVVGLYTFTLGLLMKPTRMVGKAVSQVFYQNASRKVANNESIFGDTIRLVKNLALVGSLIFFPVLIAGPYLFSFVYGDKWWNAGVIAMILSPYLFVKFLTSPLSNIAIIFNKQKVFMIIAMIMNILFPLVLIISANINISYVNAFIIATAIIVTYYFFIIKWIVNLTKNNEV